jgi:hypothetical protein
MTQLSSIETLLSNISSLVIQSANLNTNIQSVSLPIVKLIATTTNATPKNLTTDNTEPSSVNQISLDNAKCYLLSYQILAAPVGNTSIENCKSVNGVILVFKNNNVINTKIITEYITDGNNTDTWSVNLVVDSNLHILTFVVTGSNNINIEWQLVGTINKW